MNNDLTKKLNAAQSKVRDVLDNREDAHGPIGECFTGIAQVWSGLVGIEIMPQQVAYMLAAMKMVRHRHNAYESDHALDIHGYAAIAHVMDDDDE